MVVELHAVKVYQLKTVVAVNNFVKNIVYVKVIVNQFLRVKVHNKVRELFQELLHLIFFFRAFKILNASVVCVKRNIAAGVEEESLFLLNVTYWSGDIYSHTFKTQ